MCDYLNKSDCDCIMCKKGKHHEMNMIGSPLANEFKDFEKELEDFDKISNDGDNIRNIVKSGSVDFEKEKYNVKKLLLNRTKSLYQSSKNPDDFEANFLKHHNNIDTNNIINTNHVKKFRSKSIPNINNQI